MAITSVSSATFLSDSILLIRDKLKNNITDPLTTARSGSNKFVYTSYPKNEIMYPIITVTDRGIIQSQRLGMGSEGTAINIDIEIRIWGRDIKERDELFQETYDYLRQNQLDSSTGLVESNLNGFTLLSAVNVDEDGEAGIKSKVMEVRFLFICE